MRSWVDENSTDVGAALPVLKGIRDAFSGQR
jgi:hypothetical protein